MRKPRIVYFHICCRTSSHLRFRICFNHLFALLPESVYPLLFTFLLLGFTARSVYGRVNNKYIQHQRISTRYLDEHRHHIPILDSHVSLLSTLVPPEVLLGLGCNYALDARPYGSSSWMWLKGAGSDAVNLKHANVLIL